jgi:hypothetical protein
VIHHDPQIARSGCFNQPFGLFGARGQRLFEDCVLVCLENLNARTEMGMHRGRDNQGIDTAVS